MNGVSAFMRRRLSSLSAHHMMIGMRRKPATAIEEAVTGAGTLIFDFLVSRTVRHNVCCLSHV